MRGGSRSTLSSFSVMIPWYVVSIHGLCLFTVEEIKRDIGQESWKHFFFWGNTFLRLEGCKIVSGSNGYQLTSRFTDMWTLASFSPNEAPTAFIFQNERRVAFIYSAAAKVGYHKRYQALRDLRRLSIVSLLNPFVCELACDASRLQKKLQWLTYLGCFGNECGRRGGGLLLPYSYWF